MKSAEAFRAGVLAAAKAIALPMQLIEMPNGDHRFIFDGDWPIVWHVAARYCVWRAGDGPRWELALREWL